jgi:hypothetical protein
MASILHKIKQAHHPDEIKEEPISPSGKVSRPLNFDFS